MFCAVNGAHVLSGGETEETIEWFDFKLASLIGKLFAVLNNAPSLVDSMMVSASESLVSPEKGLSLITDAI